ncbi:MAG: response regulator transcription factor [Pirellulales bacterium]|nr:response regulator transcription factor [Pirellulales bacterium]
MKWLLMSIGYEVQTCATARELLDALNPSDPSCVLVDLLLPGMSGLALCQELIASQAACSLVMISGHGDVSSAVEAVKAGVVDFLEKPCSRQRLLDTVHLALTLAANRKQELLEEKDASERLNQLSAREMEVFDGMASGLVTKEIAVRLGISPKTVDVHRHKIAQKLRIDSPTQLGHLIALQKRRVDRLRLR